MAGNDGFDADRSRVRHSIVPSLVGRANPSGDRMIRLNSQHRY